MQLITRRELIRNVAAKWREQYEPFKDDGLLFGEWNGVRIKKTKAQVADELDALDKEKATAEDVAAIIGNASWTRLTCDECGKECETVLRVGQPPDYESRTACLCIRCVKDAASLVV